MDTTPPSSLARRSRRYFVYREGTVVSSEKALAMYFEVARSPHVRTMCETGFNAGHSAAVPEQAEQIV